jgi:O-antigen ligase
MALFFTLVLIFALPANTEESGLFIAGVSPVKIAGLLAFGLTLVLILAGQELRANAAFHTAVLLYMAWIMLSSMWSVMPASLTDSEQILKENAYILMTSLLLFQVANNVTDLKFFAFALLMGGFWLIYLMLRDYQGASVGERYMIEGFDSNEIAVELAMIFPMAIYLLINTTSWWWRLPTLLYFPLAIFSILIGGSRTGAIVMLLSLSGLWVLAKRMGLVGKTISLAILVILLIGAASTIPQKTLERILSTGQEISSGTLNERSVIWSYAYEEWVKSPIYGHGNNSFRRSVNAYNVQYVAHNSFISLAVEQGVIGVILYVGVLVTSLVFAMRLPSDDRIPMLSMLAVVIIGQMSLTLHSRAYLWFVYAFPVLIFSIKNNPRPRTINN